MNTYPTLVVNGFLVLNIALSIGVAWICICRLSVMDRQSTKPTFRLSYAFIFVAAIGNGASRWLFNEQPGPGTLLIVAALLGSLVSGVKLWRNGVPDVGRTRPAALDEVVQ